MKNWPSKFLGFFAILLVVVLSYTMIQSQVLIYNTLFTIGPKSTKQWVLDKYDNMNSDYKISGYQLALRDSDSDINCHALESLSKMGPKAHSVVPDIATKVYSHDPEVKRRSCTTLSTILSQCSWCVFPSYDMLSTKKEVVDNYEKKSDYISRNQIINLISLQLFDENQDVREAAAYSLYNLKTKNFSPVVYQRIKDAYTDESIRVKEWIWRMGCGF